MVADALVYHPAVTHYLRYVATTGRHPLPGVPLQSRVSNIPQSAATRSSEPSSTLQDFMPGTSIEPTTRLAPSSHGLLSRTNSASLGR